MRNEIRIKEVMGCAASATGEETVDMSYHNERRNSEPNCAPLYEEGVEVGKLSRALYTTLVRRKIVMEPRTYGRIPIGAGLQLLPSANAAPKRQGGISTPVV